VLLFLGCTGLLVRAHELSTDLAGLSGIAMALWGLALALRRPLVGGAITGAGIGVAMLGDGFLPAGMVLALLAVLPLAGIAWRTRDYARTVLVALAVAVPLAGSWPLALYLSDPGKLWLWMQATVFGQRIGPSGLADLVYYARLLPWYAWPAWPLAAWSLWRARRVLAERNDLLLPMMAFVAFFVMASLFGDARDVNAMPLLLPLAMLGVAELESLPRGAASALDWFGMTTFFLFGALIWLGWTAALTGSPEFAAAWIRREIPRFQYGFSFIAFALAALLTLTWLVVVARSLRSTRRAVVNWTAGIAMVWMLMMTLGLPLVDQARSYRRVASQIVENLPQDFTCVARQEGNLGDAQRALLDYFVNLQTVPLEWPLSSRCRALLVQESSRSPGAAPDGWVEAWRGSRPGDRTEHFILYFRR
jgi:4-amino-4-deoxy-L-arabinose transferase-like glycosyltransferase